MAEGLGKRLGRLRGEARAEAIREVVARWRESGKSQAAFCRAAGIATVTLGRWRREAGAAKGRKHNDPVLVEVGVRGQLPAEGFEIVLVSGIRVRLGAGFRDGDLSRLLAVLAATC